MIDRQPRGGMLVSLLLVNLLAVLLIPGCGKKSLENLRDQGSNLNLILVTVDSLRRDHLTAYGYDSLQTPALSELANGGVVFEDTSSTAPVSFPSHASILTGLYTPRHGARHTGTHKLPDRIDSIAEILRDAGFATGGFVSSAILGSASGLDQGFETYDDRFRNAQGTVLAELTERPATRVADAASQFIRREMGSRFFAWIHFADPREPYRAPERFFGQAQSGVDSTRQYDAEIAYVDFEIGRLLTRLEEWGVRENTVLAVVGTHGESLLPGDHQEPYHGNLLYQSTLAVPMILNAPSVLPGERLVTSLASTVDLTPTLLDTLGLAGSNREMDGISHLPEIFEQEGAGNPQRTIYAETLFPLVEHGWSPLYSIRNPQYKLIVSPSPELYDLRADPKEEKNLYEVQEALALSLFQNLDPLVGEESLTPTKDPETELVLTEELRQHLDRLGYLGEFPEVSEEELLLNPKDLMLVAIALIVAKDQMGPGKNEARYEEVVKFLTEINYATPRVLARLSIILMARKEFETALAVLERAVAEEPTFAFAHLQLARVKRALENPKEALESLDKAVELDDRSTRIFTERGHVLSELFRQEEAETAFRRAIEIDPLCYPARNGLALVLSETDRIDEAIETYQSVLRNRNNDFDAILGQARLFEKSEQYQNAVRGYTAAMRFAAALPDNEAVLRELADAMQRLVRPEEKFQILGLLSQKNPEDASLHLEIAVILASHYDRQKEAIDRLDLLLQLDQENTEALTMKATILRHLSKFDESRQTIEKALAIDGQNPDALFILGMLHNDLGETKEALETLEKAAANDTTGHNSNELAWLLITIEEEKYRDPERAILHSEKAVAANPKDSTFVDTLARAHAMKKDFEKARQACEQFLESRPQGARIYSTLGDIQKMSGEIETAASSYSKSAEVYREQGRLRMALEEVDKAIALKPENEALKSIRSEIAQERESRVQERERAQRRSPAGAAAN